VSSVFSVSPLPDGRYVIVFAVDTLSDKEAVRFAATPTARWALERLHRGLAGDRGCR